VAHVPETSRFPVHCSRVTTIPERGALYYPYIHVRDDAWLKATLLSFPFLERMVPEDFVLSDTPVAQIFAGEKGRLGGKMLGARSLDDGFVETAQQVVLVPKLDEDLTRDGNAFLQRFDRTSAARDPHGDSWFQLHEYKVATNLRDRLQQLGLMWKPSRPHDARNTWWAMHPELGAAINATNAVAIAQGHGLDIVTHAGHLHAALRTKDPSRVWDVLVRKATLPTATSSGERVRQLTQFVLYWGFDLDRVSPSTIAQLSRERADLSSLRATLGELIADVEDLSEERWNEVLKKRAGEAIAAWRESPGGKTLLKELAPEVGKGVAEEAAKVAVEATMHGTFLGSLLGGVPGLVAGVLVGAAGALLKGKREKPYRFLTKMEKAGAVRSDYLLAVGLQD
jgi:hypothetical protein